MPDFNLSDQRRKLLPLLIDPGAHLPFNSDQLQRNVEERPRRRRTPRFCRHFRLLSVNIPLLLEQPQTGSHDPGIIFGAAMG
jgi:hypothetical protein